MKLFLKVAYQEPMYVNDGTTISSKRRVGAAYFEPCPGLSYCHSSVRFLAPFLRPLTYSKTVNTDENSASTACKPPVQGIAFVVAI